MAGHRQIWELGTQLTVAVQARDIEKARRTLSVLIGLIHTESIASSFDEVKLRVLQVLTNANRAVYYAGGNPDRLYQLSIELVNEMIKAKTVRQLRAMARRLIAGSVSLVPDKDFPAMERLEKAIRHIREHCTQRLSRNEVARVVGCSPSHLSAMFSKITGHTFKQVLLKYRMEKAGQLLRRRTRTITEIAFDVGYDEPGYFSTAFKRVMGVTPGQYRKKVP